MDFISLKFYLFLAIVVLAYYALPLRARWYALLVGSLAFYYLVSGWLVAVLGAMILLSYALAFFVARVRGNGAWGKAALLVGVGLVLLPLMASKGWKLLPDALRSARMSEWILPVGLSFFSLQMVAYLVDIFRGKIAPQKNLLRYTLFCSFFPQILQGPIPRYAQLQDQLCRGHVFDERAFSKGLQLILWGFFLKLMIADKAAVIVDAVFRNHELYPGAYIWVVGSLYCVQLYTDFLSCVSIAQGVSGLFGIALADNFNHPFLATSIKELWGRWHISLSSWLRDYVYIPLGGSRKGGLRRYCNIMLTFLVSGIWHGTGLSYLFWGVMNGVYQIVGELTAKPRARLYALAGIPAGTRANVWLKRLGTFFWFMLVFVIFRAPRLRDGLSMLQSMFTVFNPWILFNDSLFNLGLEWKECLVLAASILCLVKVSCMQERMCIRDRLLAQPLAVRWGVYLLAAALIWIYGTYGFGFNAQDFIYGRF